MNDSSPLTSKDVMVVLTYAPAGLGHLRVADALRDSLPSGVAPVLLGAEDEGITWIHRVMSVHPWFRSLMEWVQRGKPEDVFTRFYRSSLRRRSRRLVDRLIELTEQRLDTPKTVVVVATHFGLAHQLSAVKEKIEEKTALEVVLAVIVTDDSPQHIWYVPGADVIFVPSEKTKNSLEAYARTAGLAETKILVSAYPVSARVAEELSESDYKSRVEQASFKSEEQIEVGLPISGAAVGLTYYAHMVRELARLSRRFRFHVVGKAYVSTEMFLNRMIRRDDVEIHVASNDRDVVNKYEEVYTKNVLGFEITKPSEQSFKVLLDPSQKGGVLMLFSQPVGRQEYDNLKFIRRHKLMPKKKTQEKLWRLAASGEDLEGKFAEKVYELARSWRGVELPIGSEKSAKFIWWCMKQKVFEKMVRCKKRADRDRVEVSDKGAEKVWESVGELVVRS